jgi:hypothetical protein
MSQSGLAAVLLMVFTILLVMSYWRQIAILMLYVIVIVFCFGVYYVGSTLASMT